MAPKNDLWYERNRLATYKKWEFGLIKPETLAKEGFYSKEDGDNIECAFCKLMLGEFEKDDSISSITKLHEDNSPNCPLLTNKNRSNGPLEGVDECGSYMKSKTTTKLLLNKLAYPVYKNAHKRLETYKEWPIIMPQRPKELAAAGFFYRGIGDQCLCFYCGLGLKDWEKDDTPFEEHAKWSSNCDYLIAKKGMDFINKHRSDGASSSTNAPHLSSSTTTATATTAETTTKQSDTDPSSPDDNNLVDNKKLCLLCCSEEIQVVFLPCGHACACVDCAFMDDKCRMCGSKVEGIHRIFLP